MTNAEKFLKDGASIDEVAKAFEKFCVDFNNLDTHTYSEEMRAFLKAESKPTLTKDERVILRNINTNNYDKVGRKISGALYLGIVNEIEIDSTFEDFFQDSDLFQFIKERRRI